jgi:O-antigen/teichoic acid export membrane protein
MRAFVSVTMSLAFFPTVLLLVEAEGVTRVLYGVEYAPAAPVIRVMAVAVLFNFAAIAYLMGVLATHHDREYLVALGATAAFSVGAGLAVVPSLGLPGATVVVSMLDLIAWVFTLRTLRRFAGDGFLAEWRRPAIAAMVTAAWLVLAATAGLPFFARATVAATLYALIVYVRTTRSQADVTVDVWPDP